MYKTKLHIFIRAEINSLGNLNPGLPVRQGVGRGPLPSTLPCGAPSRSQGGYLRRPCGSLGWVVQLAGVRNGSVRAGEGAEVELAVSPSRAAQSE